MGMRKLTFDESVIEDRSDSVSLLLPMHVIIRLYPANFGSDAC